MISGRGALIAAAWALLLVASPSRSQAPAAGAPRTEQRVAALKQSMGKSAQSLRAYQWVETTTVSMKGEVKSEKQASCFYGADGKVQKTPISATPAPEKKRGLRGKAAESKGEEIQGEMKQAVQLVHSYLPPDPALLQKCKDAGKLAFEMVPPGKLGRIVRKDYRLPGDSLAITLDLATNTPAAVDVTTYLDKPSSGVTLNGKFATLADGTVYMATVALGLQAEKLSVTVANTGYRPLK